MTEEELVQAARAGDRDALQALMEGIQHRIYNLAVRMLWHPADAEDAAQEILIKVVEHLAEFRGESKFSTWVWRIATNHLLNTRKRRAEQHAVSLDAFGEALERNFSYERLDVASQVEQNLLVEETKIGCMQGMLLCLNRDERAAYILGEIFGLSDQDGAEIFGITPAAYRKRLSRARQAIRDFILQSCGLANPANRCRCRNQIKQAIEQKRLDPGHLLFARQGENEEILHGIRQMDSLVRAAALFRTHPEYRAPGSLQRVWQELLDSGRLPFPH